MSARTKAKSIVEGFDLSLSGFELANRPFLLPQTLSFEKDSEPEMKLNALDGPKTFTDTIKALPVAHFAHVNKRIVPVSNGETVHFFRLGPEFFFKEYILANFVLDTVNASDEPEAIIAANNLMMRLRVALYGHRPLNHPEFHGVAQVTVKDATAFSEYSNRLEIEGKGKTIQTAIDDFKRARGDALPDVVRNLDPDRVRVALAFLTARGAYLMGVFLPEYGCVVAMEASNDKTAGLLPSLKKFMGKPGHEIEPEGKKIYILRGYPGALEKCRAIGAKALYEIAATRLFQHLARHVPDQLVLQDMNKIERNLAAYGQYLDAKGSADWREWYDSPLHNGLSSNISLAEIEYAHMGQLRTHARSLGNSYDFIAADTPDVKKIAFKPKQSFDDAVPHHPQAGLRKGPN